MARRKRRGGRGFRVGKYVNIVFKLLGLGVATAPAIQGIKDNLSDPARIPVAVGYNYSGIDVSNPGGGVNFAQTTVGVGAILVGLLLAKVGGWLGRRF